MAKAAQPKTATKPASTALVPWDEELARDAEIAAAQEANTGGGQFFSVRGGILSFNDAPVPGNQMAVVIVNSMFENVFYEGDFDPNNRVPPTCFAFAREEADLAPHQTVVEHDQAQHDACAGCPMNAWGTADKGRGKACRNTRRLGLIPAGEMQGDVFKAYTDPEQFAKAPLGFLKLPVTSVKGYANFVKQVAAALGRPPYAIFSKIKVVPDAATQFKVLFEPLAKAPDKLREVLTERRKEAETLIDVPYNLDVEAPPANVRPPVKKAAGKKY